MNYAIVTDEMVSGILVYVDALKDSPVESRGFWETQIREIEQAAEILHIGKTVNRAANFAIHGWESDDSVLDQN